MGQERGQEQANRHQLARLDARVAALGQPGSQGILVHRDFKLLFANDAVASLFGFHSAAQFMEFADLPALFSSETMLWLRGLAEARLRGAEVPNVYELDAFRRDGTPIAIQNVSSLVEWDGQPAVMAHILDITHRQRAERIARDNARLLRSLVESSPVTLWALDLDGTIRLAEGARAVLEHPGAGSPLGHSVFEVFSNRPVLLERVRRALAGEAFRCVDEVGDVILEQHFTPTYGESGEMDGITCVSVDITTPSRAEQRASDSEQQLRSVIDALPSLIFLKDRALRYQVVNDAFASYYGVSTEEVEGLEVVDLPERVHGGRKMFSEDDLHVLRTGEPVKRSNYHGVAANGQHTDFESIKLPLRDATGAIAGIVGVAHDVTESSRARLELERYREHLEEIVETRTAELTTAQDELMRSERLATIGKLTATVSHELRNPLGTIGASFAMLRPRIASGGDERAERALERIERNIQRCVNIIEDLLDYTRTGSISRTTLELDGWLCEALADMEIPSSVELSISIASDASVSIDPERIRQCLVNLVQNAVQSLEESTAADALRHIQVASCNAAQHVVIHVTDSGPGVAPEVRSQIFEPLYSTRAFGIGLGLPLVRSIARQHGGEVRYGAPDAPAGSTFSLYLPLLPDRAGGPDCSPVPEV